MNTLEVTGVSKTFDTPSGPLPVLERLTFSARKGELICILGPSGAGKTTLLRSISGLDRPDTGSVVLRGSEIDGPPEHLAFVFQDYSRSLLPWTSVVKNVELVLLRFSLMASERRERAMRALESVGLADFASSYPWQLSGGMQQRVAIARALAYDAPLLVMDEPFAAVDAQTRAELQDLLLEVHGQIESALVFVTHDVDEAVYLADRVIVLSKRPASVSVELDVELPSPRDQLVTKADPEFARLRTEVLSAIRH
ncbi:ABC transporter ATP-binding protein [Microbacterium karelineae]|uniref:ABC transporter ATP-binding protein n=1 Tax=Microbacterium karelineae TaxID=2654283 RepID=UPI0012E9BA15|nr:ABC transporter ATP-binding protein [Microbacterium karelineae]